MKKKHIIVLYSHNPSRLEHLRKLKKLRDKYIITLVLDENTNTYFQNTKGFVDSKVARWNFNVKIKIGNEVIEDE